MGRLDHPRRTKAPPCRCPCLRTLAGHGGQPAASGPNWSDRYDLGMREATNTAGPAGAVVDGTGSRSYSTERATLSRVLHRSRRSPDPLLALCVVGLAVVLIRVASHDPTHLQVRGDEAAFVYSALSLQGGDLSYDAADHARWVALGWDDQPRGLFLQRRADGWAFAKPYGYSVLLAAPLALVGLRAVSLVGALLVAAYAGLWYAGARLRWDASTSAIVAVTATAGSHAWFYGFPAHADLFVADLVGLVVVCGLRARWRHEATALLVAVIAAGLLVTEKVPAFLALLPFLAVAGQHLAIRVKLAAGVALVVIVAASVVPYLHYSDGRSWSAYGGERYYAPGVTPWSGGSEADVTRMSTDEVITVRSALEHIRNPSPDLPAATLTYVAGQNTGVLTFLPIVPIVLVATSLAVRRRRRAGPTAEPSPDVDRPLLLAGVLSLVIYVTFYLWLFTDNYYGGAQSIGNRYFLQISIVACVVPLAGGLGRSAARMSAGLALAWAVLVLGPNLVHADRAWYDLGHQSPLQRLLPAETFPVPEVPHEEPSGELSNTTPSS